jgi:hypothetical protein
LEVNPLSDIVVAEPEESPAPKRDAWGEPRAAPRIIQVLDVEIARALLLDLFGRKFRVPFVALDDHGRLWAYGPSSFPAFLEWHLLPLPSLPNGEGGA